MKKFFTALILILAIYGCQKTDLVVSPDEHQNITTNEHHNWLKIPEIGNNSINKTKDFTSLISCEAGGSISALITYRGISGRAQAEAIIEFPANSWDVNIYGNEIDFVITVDNETASASFSPPMTFVKPPIVNMYYEGLNLDGPNCSSYKFVYLDENRNVEIMRTDDIICDQPTGYLEVINAQIPHFSRFGFLN